MRKAIYIVIVLVISIVCLGCETAPKTKEEGEGVQPEILVKFIAPSYAEAGDLFQMINYLEAVETGATPLDTALLGRIADLYQDEHSIGSLFFSSFIRQTSDSAIRDWYRDYIRIKGDSSIFTQVVLQLWQFNKSPITGDSTDLPVSTSAVGKRDEGINMFYLDTVQLWDELFFHIYRNPWEMFSIDKDSTDEEDSLSFIVGGPTNAVNVVAQRCSTPSEDDFEKLITKTNTFLREKYGEAESMDVSAVGTYGHANADRVILQFAVGPDVSPSIMNCQTDVSLYSASAGKTYSVSFFMNISTGNHNYEIAEMLFAQLVYLSALVYLPD